MDTLLFGTLSALWLGILTSISPCPLATNIVAISFIGKGVGRPYHVLLLGLSYTFGRIIAYFVLGILITKGILSIPGVSYFLQTYLNKLLGPLLIVVGMFLVELIKVNISWAPDSDTIEKHAEKDSLRGAVLLGSLFALSFCPVSAALFFGSLIPLSVKYSSVVALPPDRAMVKLTEQKTGKVRKLDAPFRERISLPDKKGYFELVQFVSNFRNLGPGFQVRLSGDGKQPALVWLFEKFRRFDQMRKGRYLFSIESYPERRYTGLQVTADPGVWVYSACMLLIVGIIVTFFMSHNRLFLEVVRNKGGSRVVIGAAANRNRLAFEEKVKKMRDDLQSPFLSYLVTDVSLVHIQALTYDHLNNSLATIHDALFNTLQTIALHE